ncbi:MAG: hypothetical protein H6Q51_1916 [Deltaproteobacteria bacterium]|nr:hypothetical protein [Deltaproteobacteria bacterium]
MRVLLAAILLLFTQVDAVAAFDPTGWAWKRTIELGRASGFVRLPIPPEVFDEAQATLNDLRVVDDSSALVPHVLHWGRVRELQKVEWRSARLLNQTYAPGRYGRVIADFGAAVEKNQVKVTISGTNYRRRVLVEGSDEGKSWEVVAQGLWLIDVSLQDQSFRVDTLKFPPNTFRHLRLTVYNIFDDFRPFAFKAVEASVHRTEGEKELVQVPVKGMTTTRDERRNHSSVDLDLGARNLPVVSLNCAIRTPYFYRAYELVGRNAAREGVPRKTESGWDTVEREAPWEPVSMGVLYRIKYQTRIEESLEIEGLSAPYRYLKLRILNAESPPVDLDNVTVSRREASLVFQAVPGRRYALVGGNPQAQAASHDLAKAIEGVDEFQGFTARLGPSHPLEGKKELFPWSERHSVLIWTVLICAVGVAVILMVRNMKRLRAPRQE